MSRIRANDPKWLNQIFNKLTVVGFVYKDGRWMWECQCECGGKSVAYPNQVISGKTKTCGCGRSVTFHDMHLKHGFSGTRLHNIWKGMRKRCNTTSSQDYCNYGGRGIRVCAEWDDFVAFRSWAIENGYADNMTIERKDNNQNYCPDNCTWIPNEKQSLNTRSVIEVSYGGKTMPVGRWADELGIKRLTVYSRIKRGKTPLQALELE